MRQYYLLTVLVIVPEENTSKEVFHFVRNTLKQNAPEYATTSVVGIRLKTPRDKYQRQPK